MTAAAYQVVVTREDGRWLADVPELDGAHTFARSLAGLDRNVREVIVLAADLPDAAMAGLVLDYQLRTGDPAVDDAATAVRALRAQADDLAATASRCTAEAARGLVARGLSVRDTAVALGISPQRVSQLTGTARAG
ncbi:MAG: hypothetical protein L0H84_13940 [Pseudonocardia sp.]|nr:hypothetical protein [Pseudonocardia sp.]